ncbi:hypothetical protein DTO166G4_6965 [Paecilomyces variotii]|uniref:Dienelactone hydrolase n=1 Tax=Byssochlamys spectabilis TaxID=264951 RepID=A0A443HYC7_BYSSP|nr:hypothetical protein C8Q69DRAFT_205186 [Paecilomyces variotii]KAJ9211451.1 hypothetical protein DTO166G4_6965 [Paecilomyces variotii]KAJ9231258.1 hypothetical protein DTO166G5_6880 [Paecilomyces variotii]KAJ9248014.1 hypothetical protein DTO207G8_7677 [Paecilomyces variotii]KAJ9307169.1 hypothetical protein DTO217A2_3407 [Paecilomyces variotii]KAJ9351906.1 hypothetical protein DTO280E4_8037 [Paecilomyces variotii]
MASISINAPGTGFISNSFNLDNAGPARICITAETEDFDTQTLRDWQHEGFDVVYVAYGNGGKEYISRLNGVKEGLGVGEQYAVIAYGDAASACLDHYRKPTSCSKLAALIAYYPTNIPDTRTRFPHGLRVLVHLAGDSVDVTTTPQALGLQGKRRRSTRRIYPGVGTGERLNIAYPTYTYEYSQPGFAEHDLEEYDRVSAEVAFTRTLDVLRKAFRKYPDLEKIWDDNQEYVYFSSKANEAMETFVTHKKPSVTFAPTLTGGNGAQHLRHFYENHFLQNKPPSMRLRLISRTIGADRIVDELYTTFEHTQEMPWMLPGVPPTNKRVEIIMVSIVGFKAGKLYSEHIYWDQASVLVQIGLLDPKLLPEGVQGVKRLPVVGNEAARRILLDNPSSGKNYHNKLITGEPEKDSEKPKLDKKPTKDKGKGKAVENGTNSENGTSKTANGDDGIEATHEADGNEA